MSMTDTKAPELIGGPDPSDPRTTPARPAPPAGRRRATAAAKPKGARRDPAVWIILGLVVVAMVFLLGLPVGKLIAAGLSAEGFAAMGKSLTTNADAFRNTLVLGLCVGVLGTFIGAAVAYTQVFIKMPGKKAMHWLMLLPTISPPFAAASAVISLFGKRGIVSYQLFGLELNIYGLPGLVLVLSMTFAPVAYLNVKGMLENLDPSMFEAAASVGASQLRTLFTITIPMIIPALLSSFLVLFVEGIADLANPLVLGGDFQVLATQIYFAIIGRGDIATAAGISIVLLLPALTVFVVQKYWASKKSVVTVTGKPTGAVKYVTAKNVTIPIASVAMVWMLLIVMVYLTIVIGGFVNIIGVDNTFTWGHYEFVQRLGTSAVKTTLMMTLIAAPIAALMALLIAWLVVRHFPKAGKILDFVGMLGTAVPGTVLGLGFALAYSSATWLFGRQILPPLAGGMGLFGGALAIIMVYIARGIPTGQQAAIANLKQISPQVEEASTSLGASGLATLRRITVPLLSPAIITSITYAITKSMTTITAIIFITTPQTKVMTSQILDEVDAGRFGNAFAYCTVLILLVLVILGLSSIALKQLNRSNRSAS